MIMGPMSGWSKSVFRLEDVEALLAEAVHRYRLAKVDTASIACLSGRRCEPTGDRKIRRPGATPVKPTL